MGLRSARPFADRTAGLNTVLDPERLQQGTRDNGFEIELAEAVNLFIDDRGQASLRNGMIEAQAGEFHSLFCKGGDCFVVQERTSDAAIMKVNADYSLAGVRSGLTKNRRMAWGQIGPDTFYSNGMQTGYIREGVSAAWPIQTYQGPEADMQFATTIPAASHIAFLDGGQIIIAVGNALFSNHSPYQYGLFHPGRGNVAVFESNVTMVAAVREGFFASDGFATRFFRRTEEWYQFRQELAESAAALEHSLAHDSVRLREIGIESPGFARVWASTAGICIGTDDGQCINITKEKVKYPSGYTAGACLIKEFTALHTAE